MIKNEIKEQSKSPKVLRFRLINIIILLIDYGEFWSLNIVIYVPTSLKPINKE